MPIRISGNRFPPDSRTRNAAFSERVTWLSAVHAVEIPSVNGDDLHLSDLRSNRFKLKPFTAHAVTGEMPVQLLFGRKSTWQNLQNTQNVTISTPEFFDAIRKISRIPNLYEPRV
jgi:hypothetical protein